MGEKYIVYRSYVTDMGRILGRSEREFDNLNDADKYYEDIPHRDKSMKMIDGTMEIFIRRG